MRWIMVLIVFCECDVTSQVSEVSTKDNGSVVSLFEVTTGTSLDYSFQKLSRDFSEEGQKRIVLQETIKMDRRIEVRGVGPAYNLAVVPIPLPDSDHELSFNVSWSPPLGERPTDYSLEVNSTTYTSDCNTPMCYESNIPGDVQSWIIPATPHPYADSCAVKPGCSYRIRLIGHPWDGHTSANLDVALDECVVGVCSCGHSSQLPAPLVDTKLVSFHGELYVNVTWRLPLPREPMRLPRGLMKQNYYVSIGKQMVSDAHPAPWYAHTINRSVETGGAVADGDSYRTILLPLVERSVQRKATNTIVLDVRLLARVILVDERGCLGPAGNATAYDPTDVSNGPIRAYVLWAITGGACVLALLAIFAVGARGAKKVLHALRPAPVSGPLEPLRLRPAWLPLQLRQMLNTMVGTTNLKEAEDRVVLDDF